LHGLRGRCKTASVNCLSSRSSFTPTTEDGVAFCLDDTDSGPYEIYIDNIRNGSTTITDFESATNQTPSYVFRSPLFSVTTSEKLLAAPNVALVTNLNADTGSNSLLASWQFRDTPLQSTWLRLTTQGTNGTPNSQVDLSQPISIRFLVLPVGQTTNAFQVSSVGDRTNGVGDNVTLRSLAKIS